jgi:hypothetical protein
MSTWEISRGKREKKKHFLILVRRAHKWLPVWKIKIKLKSEWNNITPHPHKAANIIIIIGINYFWDGPIMEEKKWFPYFLFKIHWKQLTSLLRANTVSFCLL